MFDPTSPWIPSRNLLHVSPWRRERFLHGWVLLFPQMQAWISARNRQFHVHGQRDGREVHEGCQIWMGIANAGETGLGGIRLHVAPADVP